MSDMLYSDKSKLAAKPDQVEQGPESAPSISPMRIQRLGAMDLQRLVGNQATQRLLRQTDTNSPAVIQTKMTVGAADDAYEQEADQVAAQVVSDSQPATAQREPQEEDLQAKRIQREAEGGEMEDEEMNANANGNIQTMRLQREPQEEDLQAKRIQREAEGGEMEDEEMNANANGNIQTMRLQREPQEEDLQAKRIQREAEGGEMEDEEMNANANGNIQTMRLQREPQEEDLQAKRIQREEVDMMQSFDAGADVESGIASTRGSGQALPDDTRGMMESKMGYDFSGVNIHTDSTSDSLNRAVSAKAFTTGSDVYFSEGAFNPGSKDGQQLLAHELTHVVQQGGAAPKVQTEREDN